MSRRSTVTVYRRVALAASETFVRDHLLNLRRYVPTLLSTYVTEDPLLVPGYPPTRATDERWATRLRMHLPGRLQPTPVHREEAGVRAALRSLRPDVLHAHFGTDAAVVLRAAQSLDIPLVVTWHGYDATLDDAHLSRSRAGSHLLARRAELLANAAAHIVVSQYIGSQVVSLGAPPERMQVIACGVDTRARKCSPTPPDGPVLFVGRLVPKKGCADLLYAVARYASSRQVRVIGDGPLRADLQRQAGELGVSATFMGTKSSTEVELEMRSASVVAIPSRKAASGDSEGLPVASLEAAAAGRPVVAYAHSGLVESVVDGETGMLVPEGDADGFGRALRDLLADPQRLLSFGAAGREHVARNFDIRNTTGRIENVYDAVR